VNEDSVEVLDKLAQHEELIGKLYEAYANVFPELKDLWNLLSKDEHQHATWIKELNLQASSDSRLFINNHRFKIEAINTSLEYIHKEIDRVNISPIPTIEALSITFYIEQSLIESRLFEVFETDSVELKHLLLKLNNETVNHRTKVREVLDRHRKTL